MRVLTEIQSKKLLKDHGIKTTKQIFAASPQEAASAASKLGFPLVMKIVSPDITHKTEVDGVRVDIKSIPEVIESYKSIISSARKARPKAVIEGVSVQEMADGVEIIIGVSRDSQFGPVIMIGTGGIFVEVLKDVSFRVAPISESDALEMISEIKGNILLKGVRGKKPSDLKSLVSMLLKMSKLAMSDESILEIDMNPVFVNPSGAMAADARVVLDK